MMILKQLYLIITLLNVKYLMEVFVILIINVLIVMFVKLENVKLKKMDFVLMILIVLKDLNVVKLLIKLVLFIEEEYVKMKMQQND